MTRVIDSINEFEKFFEAEDIDDFVQAMEFAKDNIFKEDYFTSNVVVHFYLIWFDVFKITFVEFRRDLSKNKRQKVLSQLLSMLDQTEI